MGWKDAPPVQAAAAPPAAADPFDALMKKAEQPQAGPPANAGVSPADGDPFSALVKKTLGAPEPVPEGMLPSYYDKTVKPITPGSISPNGGAGGPAGGAYDPSDDPMSVAAGGLVNGIPIIGPHVLKGGNQALAWLKSVAPSALGGGGTYESNLKALEAVDQQGREKHPIAAGAGELAGQVAGYGLAAAAAPAAFGIGMSSLPASIATSGATNALISGLDASQRGEDPKSAAIIGGALGVAAPAVGAAFQRFLKPAIEPYMAKLADMAINKFKIPLSGDQLSSNPFIRLTGSVAEKLPATGGTAARGARQKAFNRAVASEMGEAADSLTPDVMDTARKRIGSMFDNAAQQTPTIGADQDFGNSMMFILKDVRDPVDRALTADERKIVEKQIQRVIELFGKSGNGTITGQQYQQLTRMGTPLDKAIKSGNPNIAFYAGQIKDALDGALERFAPPEALAELRAARYQWKVMKTVENLAEKSANGDVSPTGLATEVRNRWPNMAYDQLGKSPMVDLSRIGQSFLREPGSSNTSERAAIYHVLEIIGGAAGMGYVLANPFAALGGAVAPILAGRLTGTILRSRPLVRGLINSSLKGPGVVARNIPAATMIGAETAGKNALLPSYNDARSATTDMP